ncbi:DEAD/DEAH box helicase [Thioalkalivibrio sp. ALJ15]|uniref:DEAD/DEAH box helicase n=1 Tax=Thioalkalivibrio sp. ALJ15 TaxID=748652 RepID=UPI00037FAB2C|nr:DEAD/DEAH box helicase [Thioalkalivibrio sp. ALJ15]
MSHWLLDSLAGLREDCRNLASAIHVQSQLKQPRQECDSGLLKRGAESMELVVIDIIGTRPFDWENEENVSDLRSAAADGFLFWRHLLRWDDVNDARIILRAACLAVVGERGADASRWLGTVEWPETDLDSDDWRTRAWSTIIDIWLRLIRKKGWDDRDAVLQRISDLRAAQADFEEEYLASRPSGTGKANAFELIGLYHLAKAAEIFAEFITTGKADGRFQFQQLLDMHFDRVFAVCEEARLLDLEPVARLLEVCAAQMARNSIWTVTRAVNSRVTRFVETLVDRGRGDRAIFDVLPPQRRALAEEGLLGSSRRAVVVSLPTSSGKTLIAQFRMLQAINQFDHERGWVAYLAPTRTLVSQVARQLRRDFEPLGVVVEQVSPALEVDNVEVELLTQRDDDKEFRVLVTTPEKLDLMLRQGWETKIERPLTLVVVDEAHNLQSSDRGLKLELLLATINSECENAQFLLLTPFINNASEVARWLGDQNSDDISFSVEWQPNDRLIGIANLKKGEAINARSSDYTVELESVHTTRRTVAVDEPVHLGSNHDIASTYRQASTPKMVAAIAAQGMQHRGPVIVMHAQPRWVWSLAETLVLEANHRRASDRIRLVQDFLRLEYGEEFPLINMINYGVGVHHSGLSDDVRALMEWLFENQELRFLVATTTIAQGVNFPVSGVVMASTKYYGKNGMVDMSAEDFWNIAGRAGRVGQGDLGVVALASASEERANDLRTFINRKTGDLNSALIQMAAEAEDWLSDLEGIVYHHPEWSSFVQYLAHTYQQMGKPSTFIDEIEQVLRNTYGFAKLRAHKPEQARSLLVGVRAYAEYLREPNQPLGLVDSTGFSLQSIRRAMAQSRESGISADSWNRATLFVEGDTSLQAMMGVLLRVPELRENLKDVLGKKRTDGDKLARILKDWVSGASVESIARRYFMDGNDYVDAVTQCGQNLSSKLTQTTSWGLGALLAITGSELPEDRLHEARNLPSQVFYGVNSDEAITLRLLGIPRRAALSIARNKPDLASGPITIVRSRLARLGEEEWKAVCGGADAVVYRNVWRVLEGLD